MSHLHHYQPQDAHPNGRVRSDLQHAVWQSVDLTQAPLEPVCARQGSVVAAASALVRVSSSHPPVGSPPEEPNDRVFACPGHLLSLEFDNCHATWYSPGVDAAWSSGSSSGS